MCLKLPKSLDVIKFLVYKIFIVFLLCSNLSLGQNIKIKNIKLNNKLDHFSPVMLNGKMFYSRNLLTARGKLVKDRFGTQLFTLIEANVDTQGEFSQKKPVLGNRYGKKNISVATFTNDGRYMYFTTNALEVGDNNRKDFKTYNLQLQRAEYVKGKGWTNFTFLPFCNKDFNYGHPALSPDNKTLYFVSNIEGTKGRTDLYKVSVFEHRAYGNPEKLSESINSSRTELYPFISRGNILYFSSNRRNGIGGYDIYSYNLKETDETIIPKLLPEPINSVGEDFSFFLKEDGKSGFFTSRRLRGKGNDDIYYFTGF
ncbi:MAG: hypothetical protein EVB12_05430 [Winogradskyella sp.]|nr:MAG: hypothetical protein EVB12_05430 [Winogradskyella sp.]